MSIKRSLLISIVIFLISCGNAGKETEIVEEAKTAEKITDTSASTATPPIPAVVPYHNQLEYEKLKFVITSPQSATANTFTIALSGFSMSNDTMTMDCEGTIIKSEVGELDGDNAPELLVVTQSGPDKKGKAYVFSANKNKSMSMVSLPDIFSDPKNTAGYTGQDEFALVESSFTHLFPLYENGKPMNKTRQFQYKLKPGEAMKKLVLDKTIEF
jgi:hypothetical protein